MPSNACLFSTGHFASWYSPNLTSVCCKCLKNCALCMPLTATLKHLSPCPRVSSSGCHGSTRTCTSSIAGKSPRYGQVLPCEGRSGLERWLGCSGHCCCCWTCLLPRANLPSSLHIQLLFCPPLPCSSLSLHPTPCMALPVAAVISPDQCCTNLTPCLWWWSQASAVGMLILPA